jgi:uncharacterized membrane-anchored protein YhcB (DUF1043 family)
VGESRDQLDMATNELLSGVKRVDKDCQKIRDECAKQEQRLVQERQTGQRLLTDLVQE